MGYKKRTFKKFSFKRRGSAGRKRRKTKNRRRESDSGRYTMSRGGIRL